MKITSRIAVSLCLVALALSSALLAQDVSRNFKYVQESGGIKEYALTKNGLQVLLMEDHSAPVLTFMVTYRVGSRNEAIGNTGSTHLLEHLMFKGTPTYNKSKGTAISATLQNVGARMNASTWNDRTNYFEQLPKEHLELAITIEADRMRNLLLDEKDKNSEMTVVRNEFEQGENDPEEALDKNIWATAYQAHPYHHSTIGWRSDIENVPITRLRQFYDTFYWPNNATVTLIGDFDTKNAMDLIDKYYGPIPMSPHVIPAMYTEEPVQQGPRRVIVKRSGETGIVGVAHKSVPSLNHDHYALVLLDRILSSGKNSRFYKALVDKGLASRVTIQNLPFKDAGLFVTYATLTPKTSHEDVEKIILQEYKAIQDSGVTQTELDAAKAKIRTQQAFRRDGSFSIASEINEAIAVGDWKFYTTYLDEINKITAKEIQDAARKYLVDDQMTVGYFVPTGGDQAMGSVPGSSHQARSFRGPLDLVNGEIPDDFESVASGLDAPGSDSKMADKVVDQTVAGIRVLSMKTSVQDVVTIRGSLMAGEAFASPNKALADLTAAMLDEGTTKRDKFTIAAQLEKLGASISFSAGTETMNFSSRCLRSDVPTVINILAEELRAPLFDAKAFETVKKRRIAAYKENLEDTDTRAFEALQSALYPAGHPERGVTSEAMIADIEKATLEEVKAFHQKYYGPASMILVAVGDVDSKDLQKQVAAQFSGWRGGVPFTRPQNAVVKPAPNDPIVVPMKDKTSVTVMWGTPTGLQHDDKDFLPLYVGNYILGGNFSARLMSTVRDNEGLTYGIYSFLGSDQYTDGLWFTYAAFAPGLLKKGIASAQKQLTLWLDQGVSEDELKAKKTTITGAYKVSLSTTGGMANFVLSFAQRKVAMKMLDDYPDKINALTLQQVNDAIHKYVKTGNILTVAAGSVDEKLDKMK